MRIARACVLAIGCVAATGGHGYQTAPAGYDALVALFKEWRAFQQPTMPDGVPDYSAAAMVKQQRELETYRSRLNAIQATTWPIPQQVDWHLVRAEMNGLDFDLRVLRPWQNNPAFYVTVFPGQSDQPAREGPHAAGSLELWTYTFPLTNERAAQMTAALRIIPPLLEQAQRNLTGTGRDLWTFGTGSIRQQSADLERLAQRAAGAPESLLSAIARARAATDTFAGWLDAQSASKTGPSGVGQENYTWYLQNVYLAPYTWQDEVTLMERELARAHAFLALEEQRNAALPEQVPIDSPDEYRRQFDAAVTRYMAFLRDRQILAVRDYMDPALRARGGRLSAAPREFFAEVDVRDPQVMRTHGYHWFDLARMEHDPHSRPIRRGPLLYNLFITRTEGHATGWEEMMLQAGMFDAQPRSRELIYVLLAQRAARALGDLRMHANQMTLEEAAQFTSAHTPRGWLRLDGRTVRGEQHLYLQQPGYGTSYVIGKIQIEELLGARRRQLGARFAMRQFMDEFDGTGLIPVSLLRWQMTGERPEALVNTQ
jgi:hypothetical protein